MQSTPKDDMFGDFSVRAQTGYKGTFTFALVGLMLHEDLSPLMVLLKKRLDKIYPKLLPPQNRDCLI
jgi:hypothetical protein